MTNFFKRALFLACLLTLVLNTGYIFGSSWFINWSAMEFSEEDLTKMQETSTALEKSLKGQVSMGMDFFGGVEDLQCKIYTAQMDPDIAKAKLSCVWPKTRIPSGVTLKIQRVSLAWTPESFATSIKGRCEELVGPTSVWRPLATASREVAMLRPLLSKAALDKTLNNKKIEAIDKANRLVAQYEFTQQLQDAGMKGMKNVLDFFKKAFKVKGVAIPE